MGRRLRSTLLVLLAMLATTTSALTTSPAYAADDQLLLSWDGRTWRSDLDRPLFDPSDRWVPGDRQTRTFWVRNDSDDQAYLTVDFLYDEHQRTGFADIDISATGADAVWRRTAEGASLEEMAMGPGQEEQVSVSVRFPSWSTNESMRDATLLDVRATLYGVRDSGTGPGPDGPDGPDEGPDGSGPGGTLPDTGGPAGWVGIVGAALVAIGLLLVARPRRRDDEREERW